MFKALGNAFLDVFKKPFVTLYTYIFYFIILFLTIIFNYYTYNLLYPEGIFGISLFSYWLNSQLLLSILNVLVFLFLTYLEALIFVYILNKKIENEKKFNGVAKVFGFNIFILLIIFVIPLIVLFLTNFNSVLMIIYLFYLLFATFILNPYLFMTPMLLVSLDLKSALTESFEFGKNHYWKILLFEFLFLVLFTIIYLLCNYLDLFVDGLGLIILQILTVLFFVWYTYFSYNWYYS